MNVDKVNIENVLVFLKISEDFIMLMPMSIEFLDL